MWLGVKNIHGPKEQLISMKPQFPRNKKSLMEQMLDKVTREADLQAQDLEEEKNKSDQLLFQMLPP